MVVTVNGLYESVGLVARIMGSRADIVLDTLFTAHRTRQASLYCHLCWHYSMFYKDCTPSKVIWNEVAESIVLFLYTSGPDP